MLERISEELLSVLEASESEELQRSANFGVDLKVADFGGLKTEVDGSGVFISRSDDIIDSGDPVRSTTLLFVTVVSGELRSAMTGFLAKKCFF